MGSQTNRFEIVEIDNAPRYLCWVVKGNESLTAAMTVVGSKAQVHLVLTGKGLQLGARLIGLNEDQLAHLMKYGDLEVYIPCGGDPGMYICLQYPGCGLGEEGQS